MVAAPGSDAPRRDRLGGRHRVRPIVDAAMAAVWLFQMLPGRTGNPLHEFGGVMLLGLFLAHHLLNRGWVSRLVRGRARKARVLLVGDLLLAACMGGVALTGLLMAQTLPLPHVAGVAHVVRPLHACCAYLGFLLVALHMGMHLRAMTAYAHARLEVGRWAPLALVATAALGVWAFVQLDVWTNLSLGMGFPDGVTPVAMLTLEHLALAAPLVVLGTLLDARLGAQERTDYDTKGKR